jgi:hypothetical protein
MHWISSDVTQQRDFKSLEFFVPGPFATNAPGGGVPDIGAMKIKLLKEDWYHGPISRLDAEVLLQNVKTSK